MFQEKRPRKPLLPLRTHRLQSAQSDPRRPATNAKQKSLRTAKAVHYVQQQIEVRTTRKATKHQTSTTPKTIWTNESSEKTES